MMIILKSVSLSLTASVDQLIVAEYGFLPSYNRKAHSVCKCVCVTVWIFLTQPEDLSIGRRWSDVTHCNPPDAHWSVCARIIDCTICVFSNAQNVWVCCRFSKPRWYFVSINPYTYLSVKGDQTFHQTLGRLEKHWAFMFVKSHNSTYLVEWIFVYLLLLINSD